MARVAARCQGLSVSWAVRAGLRRAIRPAVHAVRKIGQRGRVREAVDAIRGARGVRLVLVYHRVAEYERSAYDVVPTVPVDLFRQQLDAFGELAELVTIDAVVGERADPDRPLQLALTFDDDLATHVANVLPVLRGLGLHATFFLSGRALHGLGGYWFERLEALVADRGPEATADLLELPGAPPVELAIRSEADPARLALIDRHAPPVESTLDQTGIGAMRDAGMTVGFHTLHHPVLPSLDDTELRNALSTGRDALERIVGEPLRWFAYPHGKTDARTIAFTREARFSAAWTTQPRTSSSTDDPFLRGRWEPRRGPVDVQLIRLGDIVRRVG
jgi:peptidoglycan/xylan/chitin deacetylase (PgdA/CDA1 family)